MYGCLLRLPAQYGIDKVHCCLQSPGYGAELATTRALSWSQRNMCGIEFAAEVELHTPENMGAGLGSKKDEKSSLSPHVVPVQVLPVLPTTGYDPGRGPDIIQAWLRKRYLAGAASDVAELRPDRASISFAYCTTPLI